TIHVADPHAFWKPYDETNERWEELRDHPSWWFGDAKKYPPFHDLLEALNRVIKRNPGTTFICAHCGNNAEDLQWVAKSLDAAPNMMVDLAARIPEIGRKDPEKVREFFTKYADRILFGTDFMVYGKIILGSSGNEPPPTDDDAVEFYQKHWRFFDTADRYFPHMTPIQGNWPISAIQLPPDVQRKILFDNANRILAPFMPLPTAEAVPCKDESGNEATINLDGKLDEAVWQKAVPIRIESALVGAEAVPGVSTTARILYGDEAIYVGFEAPFTELTVFEPVQETKRLGLWEKDVVEVFLGLSTDPINKYKEFEVAPTGEKLEVALNLPEKDFDWNSGFTAATNVDNEKKIWTAEVRIPYSAISENGKKPTAGDKWKANFYRSDRANRAFVAWSPALTNSAHTPKRFGTLLFK
ncbi:MAG: amidohydrolase family protein, partial [Thermoguttaceae bacterium]